MKSNIRPITNGLNSILRINTYSYNIIDNYISKSGVEIEGTKREYGFLSQEIEKVFPDINITDDVQGLKLMDYNQIIPLAVAAIKEQQEIINLLKLELDSLKRDFNIHSLVNNEDGVFANDLDLKESVLFQNRPNPFNEKTLIECQINEDDFDSASIIIFDMNGTLLNNYTIRGPGKQQLIINGLELKAGMYFYTLIGLTG